MEAEIILGIVGVIGTVALSINGYFLRGIYKDLNEVKIDLAKMIENSESKEFRIKELEKEHHSMRKKFHDVNNKIAALSLEIEKVKK